MAGLDPAIHDLARNKTWMPGTRPGMTKNYFSTQSAHFGTSVVAPHGMIGTVEVEFFGEPSISRSE
jgi:hypothetical protein